MRIAVIGLGAVGAQVLWQLSRRDDVEVHGFDTAYPGHSMAGAGGESRLFWNLELAEPAYTPLIQRASAVWRELEDISGVVLRDRTGVLLYGDECDTQIECALQSLTGRLSKSCQLPTCARVSRSSAFATSPWAYGIRKER